MLVSEFGTGSDGKYEVKEQLTTMGGKQYGHRIFAEEEANLMIDDPNFSSMMSPSSVILQTTEKESLSVAG